MPLFRWHCPKCKITADIIRNFDNYRDPPAEEEVSGFACDHEWEKEIGTPSVVKGPNWGYGSKGNW